MKDLDSVYVGLERAFRLIAAEIDDSVPKGENWHEQLCAQMFLPVAGLRDAVLGSALRPGLDDLRAFRRRARNLYGAEINEKLVLEKPAAALALTRRIEEAIGDFARSMSPNDYEAIFAEAKHSRKLSPPRGRSKAVRRARRR